ncbi:hypothetical protein I553_9444 [Mycobacterium xenopi 4042]|uniref:Uncharacterized protein n=1 Tax=Mycobacterium xenopi 4042 TaxID=1299334 RepID=X8E058_MYCXE|nr:hypothetical protein I553_9444 [Mycobacterium xenopi 4042]
MTPTWQCAAAAKADTMDPMRPCVACPASVEPTQTMAATATLQAARRSDGNAGFRPSASPVPVDPMAVNASPTTCSAAIESRAARSGSPSGESIACTNHSGSFRSTASSAAHSAACRAEREPSTPDDALRFAVGVSHCRVPQRCTSRTSSSGRRGVGGGICSVAGATPTRIRI